jgi:hypothetical protein
MAQAQHEMEAEDPAIEHPTERGMSIAQLEVWVVVGSCYGFEF